MVNASAPAPQEKQTITYQDTAPSGLLEEEQKRHAYSALFSVTEAALPSIADVLWQGESTEQLQRMRGTRAKLRLNRLAARGRRERCQAGEAGGRPLLTPGPREY